MQVRYIGLTRILADRDEEDIPVGAGKEETTLENVIAAISARHGGDLKDVLDGKGHTHLGQISIQVDGRTASLVNARAEKVSFSSEITVLIVPIIVGG